MTNLLDLLTMHNNLIADAAITQELRPDNRYASKLNPALVRKLREDYADPDKGLSIQEMSAVYSVSYQTMYDCLTGRTWKTAGGPISGRDGA